MDVIIGDPCILKYIQYCYKDVNLVRQCIFQTSSTELKVAKTKVLIILFFSSVYHQQHFFSPALWFTKAESWHFVTTDETLRTNKVAHVCLYYSKEKQGKVVDQSFFVRTNVYNSSHDHEINFSEYDTHTTELIAPC